MPAPGPTSSLCVGRASAYMHGSSNNSIIRVVNSQHASINAELRDASKYILLASIVTALHGVFSTHTSSASDGPAATRLHSAHLLLCLQMQQH